MFCTFKKIQVFYQSHANLRYVLIAATWTSLRMIVLVELFGIDSLTNAFGWLAMFQGAGFFIGPPIAGAERIASSRR